jgi:nucleoside-diphosphate-sugar epimerase
MKILVTGSSGFIGTTLVRRLSAIGNEVAGLDRFPPREYGGAKFYRGDLLDSTAITRAIFDFRPEAIVHLAARTSLKQVPPESDRFHANTVGTRNVINAAAGVDVRRVVFTSTKYVYRGNDVPAHREYRPATSYGLSKAEMEELVWTESSRIPEWCITRPTTVWGPGMGRHYQRFLSLLLNERYFHVGRREVLKHMAFIENIAHQYCGLLAAPPSQVHQQIFYLADYEPYELRVWANTLAEALGAAKPKTLPYPAAKTAALVGDCIVRIGFRKFPYNSFRLGNITQDDIVDVGNTRQVCGELPFSTQEAVRKTALWFNSVYNTQC